MGAPEPDVWAAGGLGEKRAARYLDVSRPLVRRLARELGWPRKRIRGTTRVVYPRALVRRFLRECEDA